jgi:hypothetical protein
MDSTFVPVDIPKVIIEAYHLAAAYPATESTVTNLALI